MIRVLLKIPKVHIIRLPAAAAYEAERPNSAARKSILPGEKYSGRSSAFIEQSTAQAVSGGRGRYTIIRSVKHTREGPARALEEESPPHSIPRTA